MDRVQMQSGFKGLSNTGATCYMNSLLQTLYMTPEFKRAIYEWEYDERVHPREADSILYQLQKLFGKLDSRFPGEVSTGELIKSFQWEDEEAHMQQDIQEFNRVLFEALEKSVAHQPLQHARFLRDLYQGEMVHYTHCEECGQESQREESFQDLLLSVKNPLEKVYNNCVEVAIQRYMKPQTLDQDNLYFCESCQKKVVAQRGVRFLKMPRLLSIIVRRFDFDYFSFERVKLNDRVEFPHILNINDYMNGYDNIKHKLSEDSAAYFQQQEPPRKKVTTGAPAPRKVVAKKSSLAVAGKVTTKPSVNTKSFLAEMRKKKVQAQAELNEDLLYVSGSTPLPDHHKEPILLQEPTHQSPQDQHTQEQSQEKSKGETQEKTNGSGDQRGDQEKGGQENKPSNTSQCVSADCPLPPALDLVPPPISAPFSTGLAKGGECSVEEELQRKIEENKKCEEEKEERLLDLASKKEQLIQEYLKEGSLVYELYSILVHSGTANHGHYFSYIKSPQGNWFCFNDERVSEINVTEIEKAFGGVGHSNAYALSYRQVQPQGPPQGEAPIPTYIIKALGQEAAALQQRNKEKMESLESVVVLKIYYQLSVKVLEVGRSSPLSLCLAQARSMFNIGEEVPTRNLRLRMFNPVTETKLDTYGGREACSLEELKISSYKNLLLEVKTDHEEFEEYSLGKISIRVAFWEQCQGNMKSLDESFLTLHRVPITRGSSMADVERAILDKKKEVLPLTEKREAQENEKKEKEIQKGELGQESICIIKRHQNDEYSYHEVINLPEYRQKSVDEVMVMENEILFVEPASNQLMWPIEFENETYRITIKYVNADNQKSEMYLTDSRKSIGELKRELCGLLSLPCDDTIIRRGSKSGMELKNEAATMKELRFISGTQVYLEKGLPARQGEVRVQLFLATDAPAHSCNRLHEFEFVGEVPVNGQLRASEVKEVFCKVLSKYKGLQLHPTDFRIREKVLEKIGKIYRERPMKEQQLIEKREIAIERRPEGVDTKDLKDFSIYVRVWDPETWTLSPKVELIVDKGTTLKDLGRRICGEGVAVGDMEICRILSLNKFNMLDLVEMEYYDMDSEAPVLGEPLFVNADGLVFVAKNKGKAVGALTKEQQAQFGGILKAKPNPRAKPRALGLALREKGITIKVVHKQQTGNQEQTGAQDPLAREGEQDKDTVIGEEGQKKETATGEDNNEEPKAMTDGGEGLGLEAKVGSKEESLPG